MVPPPDRGAKEFAAHVTRQGVSIINPLLRNVRRGLCAVISHLLVFKALLCNESKLTPFSVVVMMFHFRGATKKQSWTS
jgi:hypothetical protein